jgi:hypothetical protein
MQTVSSKYAYARQNKMVVVFDNCWSFEAVGPEFSVTVDRRPASCGGFRAKVRDRSKTVVQSGTGDSITKALQALAPA